MWWTGSAFGLDFETDGRDPTEARIITGAMVLVTPDNEPNAMELMIQPERPIPQEAIGIHGITNERAMEEGVLREVGIPQIAMTIAELACPEIPVVGHNISYDLTLLDREMRRLRIGHLIWDPVTFRGRGVMMVIGDSVVAEFYVIDTYVIDKAVDKYRLGKRKLSFAAEHYGCPMAEGSAHGATADVFAALRIAFKLHQRGLAAADYFDKNHFGDGRMTLQHHPFMRHYAGRRDSLDLVRSFAGLSCLSLTELHERQVVWAREQADSLREYFFEQGKQDEAASVDGSWPLRTLTDGAPEIETVSTELV